MPTPTDTAPSKTSGRLAPWLGHAVAGAGSLLVGFHAGGLVAARWGIGLGLAVGIAVAAAVWVLQGRLRRTPGGRLAWRIAVVAHVAFWTGRGLHRTTIRAPAGAVVTRSAGWGAPQPFLAGVATAPFDLPPGTPIAGWGRGERRVAWPHLRGAGVLGRLSMDSMAGDVPMLVRGEAGPESLGAKAVVLRGIHVGTPPLAVCRLDLVVSDERLHRAVFDRIADLGFDPATLLLCATHTHSGPGGFARVRLACLVGTDAFDPEIFRRIADAAARAIRSAHGSAVPARIGFVRARDRGPDGRPALAKNRRGGDENADRVDDEVLGIRLDAADGSQRIALVLNYAVHPTWLRPRSRVFSQDVAGALERSVPIAAGSEVLFVNGAEGDIAPRVRPSADGSNPIAEFEAAVAKDLSSRATADRLSVRASRVRWEMGSAHTFVCLGRRDRFAPTSQSAFGRGAAGVAAGVLALPANAALWSTGVADLRCGFTFDGSAGLVACLDGYLEGTEFPFGAVRLQTSEGTALVAWLPVEATHTVGAAIKRAGAATGASPVFVFGLTNAAMGYCASHAEYMEGGYESLCTLFGPSTSSQVESAMSRAFELLR